MASPINRSRQHRMKRNVNPPINQPPLNTPVVIADAAAEGSVLTLTFDQPVSLNGTPGITTDVVGAEPVSAVKTSPNVVAITFDAAIAAATSLNIPFRDPAIRNSSGGYVISNTFPLAA